MRDANGKILNYLLLQEVKAVFARNNIDEKEFWEKCLLYKISS